MTVLIVIGIWFIMCNSAGNIRRRNGGVFAHGFLAALLLGPLGWVLAVLIPVR